MESTRIKKVEGQLQKDLAEIFREIAQDQFKGLLLTVTRVRLSADFSIARVNLSVFPATNKEEVIGWVTERKNHIKDQLVQKLEGRLRKMPELYFHLDDSLDQEAEIDRILREGGDSPIK